MKNKRIYIYILIFFIILCLCLFSKNYLTDSNVKINNDVYIRLEKNLNIKTTFIPKHNKINYLELRFESFGNEYLNGNITLNLIRKKDNKKLYEQNIDLSKLKYVKNNMYYTFEVDDSVVVKGEEYIVDLKVNEINSELSIYSDFNKKDIQIIYGYIGNNPILWLYMFYYLLIICILEIMRVGDKDE